MNKHITISLFLRACDTKPYQKVKTCFIQLIKKKIEKN